MKTDNNFLGSLLVFLVAICISVTFLEILLSRYFPSFNPSGKFDFYRNEDGIPLGIKNFSGRYWDNAGDFNVAVSINKYGFRDNKDFKMSTACDFFAVGDSFSFGYGVEEEKRYSNLLERMIEVNIYNISMPGDLDDYAKIIKYALDNKATITNIILGLCMENDLADYDSKENRPYVDNKGLLINIKDRIEGISTTYNLVSYIVLNNKLLKNIFIKAGLVRGDMGIPEITYSESMITSSANKLTEITREYNSIIIIIPSRGLWVGKNKNAELATHVIFVQLLQNKGLNVVDMRPYFEQDGNPLQYYFHHDGHWNEKGHLKAAQRLYPVVRALINSKTASSK